MRIWKQQRPVAKAVLWQGCKAVRVYPCTVTRSYQAAADPVVTTDWLAQHLEEVAILDVRGHVDTQLVQPGVEESTYVADYDAYLEGHIPVSLAVTMPPPLAN